jgi:P-type conjugative transfer protein TrbJ
LRGTLDTVHEQLRPEQQTREDALLAVLQAKSDGAAGNLDVTQAGNMLIGQVIEEQRKLRQLMGALINAHNVTAAREINEHAAAERIMQEWFAKGAEVEIKPLTGEGGFGRLGPTR